MAAGCAVGNKSFRSGVHVWRFDGVEVGCHRHHRHRFKGDNEELGVVAADYWALIM